MFEALHEAGGVLIYGIPAFRLPKDVVAAELDGLRQNNVEFRTNWVGGRTVSVQQLFDEGYKAVFIGVGAGLPQFLGIPGENLIGVFSANEYLTRVNLGRAYEFPQFRHADLSRQACDGIRRRERGDGRRAYGSAPRGGKFHDHLSPLAR